VTVISLFDLTGVMLRPWAQNGYQCFCYDIQHDDVHKKDGITYIHADLSKSPGTDYWLPREVSFVSAFPPCTHLAVSGARWFKGKGLRKLAEAIELFACAAEICESTGAPYMIENPVSTISTYWRKPDHKFHPWHFSGIEEADHYTKQTCLWAGGGFNMPVPDPGDFQLLGDPDDRIHKAAPSPERTNFRSATPLGFAQAVFEANRSVTGPAVEEPTSLKGTS
jgi:hypothetical protein